MGEPGTGVLEVQKVAIESIWEFSEMSNSQINQHRDQMKQILYGSLEQYFLQFIGVLEKINDCNSLFQVKLNNLWNEIQQKEAENKLIIESLDSHRSKLNDYRRELAAIRGYLETWKP